MDHNSPNIPAEQIVPFQLQMPQCSQIQHQLLLSLYLPQGTKEQNRINVKINRKKEFNFFLKRKGG